MLYYSTAWQTLGYPLLAAVEAVWAAHPCIFSEPAIGQLQRLVELARSEGKLHGRAAPPSLPSLPAARVQEQLEADPEAVHSQLATAQAQIAALKAELGLA